MIIGPEIWFLEIFVFTYESNLIQFINSSCTLTTSSAAVTSNSYIAQCVMKLRADPMEDKMRTE
jgi:hypothetical protein